MVVVVEEKKAHQTKNRARWKRCCGGEFHRCGTLKRPWWGVHHVVLKPQDLRGEGEIQESIS